MVEDGLRPIGKPVLEPRYVKGMMRADLYTRHSSGKVSKPLAAARPD